MISIINLPDVQHHLCGRLSSKLLKATTRSIKLNCSVMSYNMLDPTSEFDLCGGIVESKSCMWKNMSSTKFY